MQNSVDPHPRTTRKTTAETPDTPCPDRLPERVKQSRPISDIVYIALGLICPPCWRPGRRRIGLVNRVSGVRDSRSHFVRRTDAVRPITDAATLDAALECRSPCHTNIIRVKTVNGSLWHHPRLAPVWTSSGPGGPRGLLPWGSGKEVTSPPPPPGSRGALLLPHTLNLKEVGLA